MSEATLGERRNIPAGMRRCQNDIGSPITIPDKPSLGTCEAEANP
jgi:hypothetical protein